MVRFNRFVGGLNWNSAVPGGQSSNQPIVFKWGGRGGFPKNLATQVAKYLIILLIILFNQNTAYAKESVKVYKQEWFKQLDYSFDQFDCVDRLLIQESNWNPKAQNNSHYGIPQGRSIYLKTANYKQQATWHIKYLKNRYGVDRFGTANACAAWAHWLEKGWH